MSASKNLIKNLEHCSKPKKKIQIFRNLCKSVFLFLLILPAVSNLVFQELATKKVLDFTENEEDDNYIFFQPSAFDIDEKENIYILDSGNGRIQKYDNKGKYVKTIGRKGKGPGEFYFPNSIKILDSEILVYDQVNIRITRFTYEDELVDSFVTKQYFREIVFDNKGKIYQSEKKIIINSMFLILSKYDSKGNFEFNIGKRVPLPLETAVKRRQMEHGTGTGYVPLFGSVILFTVDKNNNVYANYPYNSSQIVKYSSSGTELLKISPKLERIVVDDADRKFLSEKYEEFDSIYIPKYKPFIKFITTDDKNNIWIATYEGEIKGEIHFHIISEEGKFLNKAVISAENPRTARRIKIKKDNIYVFFYHQDKGVRFIKYKII